MNVLLRYKSGLTCIVSGLVLVWLPVAGVMAADPTKPLIALGGYTGQSVVKVHKKKKQPLKLHSVITKGSQAIAVINRQPVKIGQRIEGYKVTAITPYGVQLNRNGKKLSLSLFNLKIRKNDNE